ncbi:hypothetical protein P3T37_007026 [Kitasatospora sp. MAA4]|uniref:hypothetical protein n=1 Tax=Kitasatospora sp. MAA4 TaxID=3035093 RepID=UPI002473C358|nr:hypothetical protein [Kitasatospora sp. MAA4]MDH6137593.1 hypothetical protein [Kitasatospora sp. MAA4]
MSDGQTSEGSGNGHERPSVPGYAWVTTCSIESFVRRMQAIRLGTANDDGAQPATALRLLHAFAVSRSIDDLLTAASASTPASRSGSPPKDRLNYWDSVNMLATAALCRSAEHAAELACKQWDAEGRGATWRGTPLTDGIVHDVACQRTAPDVAVFVRECGRAEGLVDKTLRVFTRPSSGRTNLDKVLLYILLRDQGCDAEATKLLFQTLSAIDRHGSTQAADTDPAEFHDLVGALYQLSPAEQILENWVDAQLGDPEQVITTRRIVARLIASETGSPDTLVEHVGARLSRHDIVEICGQLATTRPEKCDEIRRHAAALRSNDELAEIVIAWHRSQALTRTTKDLLADIVAIETGGATGPRPRSKVDDLDKILANFNAEAECRRLLWIVAAEHVDGRSGIELAELLGRVERTSDRYRVARTTARKLTAHVLRDGADPGLFVDYVTRLRVDGRSDAVFLSLKELADPSDPLTWPEGSAQVIAEIAVRLYARDAARDGWDLLERCLENEQRISHQDVAAVVTRLREPDSTLPDGRRLFLLRATVGRWADTHAREDAVELLRENGYDEEAAEVIRSLR